MDYGQLGVPNHLLSKRVKAVPSALQCTHRLFLCTVNGTSTVGVHVERHTQVHQGSAIAMHTRRLFLYTVNGTRPR